MQRGLKAPCLYPRSKLGTFLLCHPETHGFWVLLVAAGLAVNVGPPCIQELGNWAPSSPYQGEGAWSKQRARPWRVFGEDGKVTTDLWGRKVSGSDSHFICHFTKWVKGGCFRIAPLHFPSCHPACTYWVKGRRGFQRGWRCGPCPPGDYDPVVAT